MQRAIAGSSLLRRADESRRTGPSYQDIIRGDRVAPPADIRESHAPDLPAASLARDRYTGAAFHAREMAKMWPRVWQFACREDEVRETGDISVYELGDNSILIVRGRDGGLRAFRNTCLHRGTKLCLGDTHLAELRCPFHGFTWDLEGALVDVPSRWDFPYLDEAGFRLHEVRCETWAGFVFINMDPAAAPLLDYLEVLPQHFTGVSDYAKKYCTAHYLKRLPCNWKAAIEAFVENYHSLETHPETVRFNADDNTQYDIFPGNRHVSRFMIAQGVQSPHLVETLSEAEILAALYGFLAPGAPVPAIPPGMTARTFLADLSRQMAAAATGNDYSVCSDVEALDPLQYFLFPNMILFRGLGFPMIYRFRPDGDSPSACIFEMYVMRDVPASGERPDPPEIEDLGGRSYREAALALPEWLRLVYDQDTQNLGLQQQGLKAGGPSEIWLSRAHEIRIRHMHDTLDRYLAGDEADRG
jgi:nitrite reductase/ring-hydroxylating ferredoxin subunit